MWMPDYKYYQKCCVLYLLVSKSKQFHKKTKQKNKNKKCYGQKIFSTDWSKKKDKMQSDIVRTKNKISIANFNVGNK
jgi:hypothetical protein